MYSLMSCDDVDNGTLPRLLYLQSTEQAAVEVSTLHQDKFSLKVTATQDPNVSVCVFS